MDASIRVIMRKRRQNPHPTTIAKIITMVIMRTIMLSMKRSRGTITKPNQFRKMADKTASTADIAASIPGITIESTMNITRRKTIATLSIANITQPIIGHKVKSDIGR